MSVHAQTRDLLLEQGAVPLMVRGLGAAETPTDRVHAIRCLLNFAWAGSAAAKQLREAGTVEAAKPWAEAADGAEMEVRDAARGLLQTLGVAAAAAAPTSSSTPPNTATATDDDSAAVVAANDAGGASSKKQDEKRYGVFLSHKQTDAQDFARSLYTMFESRNIKCYLDIMEFRDDLNDLEAIVSTCRTLLFVLSDKVLESEWCLIELAAAVRHKVKIVMVVKEGSRWPDKNGHYTCTFPPYPLIQQLPAEAGLYSC